MSSANKTQAVNLLTGPGWELHRFDSAATLANEVAGLMLSHLESLGRESSIALSGGRISEPLFDSLAQQAAGKSGLLRGLRFYWADERFVPLDDPSSNYWLAQSRLFEPLGISRHRCFPFHGETPENAAALGRAALESSFGIPPGETPVFDLILLGMGEDGHVASLFPENIAEDRQRKEPCFNVVGSKPPPDRISLGYSVMAAAREVWLVISGAGKAKRLGEVLAGSDCFPASLVLSDRKLVRVFTDFDPSDPAA